MKCKYKCVSKWQRLQSTTSRFHHSLKVYWRSKNKRPRKIIGSQQRFCKYQNLTDVWRISEKSAETRPSVINYVDEVKTLVVLKSCLYKISSVVLHLMDDSHFVTPSFTTWLGACVGRCIEELSFFFIYFFVWIHHLAWKTSWQENQ